MARNTYFHPDHEPLRNIPQLQLSDHIDGPFSFLNPTQARYRHVPAKSTTEGEEPQDRSQQETTRTFDNEEEVPVSEIGYKWTSRNNRKGRHQLVIKPSDIEHAKYATPRPTSHPVEVLKNIGRMFWYFPVWDVSYLVAMVFTWGSVIWVINAFFAFLPFTDPSSAFPGETLYGGGITAFIGATVFEIGSVLLMLEAVNENRSGCFGWALEQVWDERFANGIIHVRPRGCTHHHQNKRNLIGKAKRGADAQAAEKNGIPIESTDGTPPGDRSWVWWPSWQELKTHYFHDLGFIACSLQMFGATVFWISGFTALPGIYNNLSPQSVLNGVYWVPQVVGGAGFVISGTLFMIETQKHWWLPAPTVLGWHIGLWNLIGGVGFTLCPIFGFSNAHWRQYQAACSTFWGECIV
jgi:hypothetical protein